MNDSNAARLNHPVGNDDRKRDERRARANRTRASRSESNSEENEEERSERHRVTTPDFGFVFEHHLRIRFRLHNFSKRVEGAGLRLH